MNTGGDQWALWGLARDVGMHLLFVLMGLLIARYVLGRAVLVNYELFALLLAGGFLLLGIAGHLPTPSLPSSGTTTRRQLVIVLGALCLLGALFRLYALDAQSFWFDEAITTTAAIGLLEQGNPGFPSGVGYRRGIAHTVLVAGSLFLFGVTEWVARFPAAVVGVATIPVTYALGREVGNWRIGLVAAALVTFLTWEIAWGRQARMYQQLQLLYTVTLIGLARSDRTGLTDRLTLGLVIGGAGVAALTHTIGLVLLPLTVGYLLFGQWRAQDGFSGVTWAFLGGTVVLAVVVELLGAGPLSVTRTILSTDIVHIDRYRWWVRSEFGLLYFLTLVGFGLSFRSRHGPLLALALLPPLWVLGFNTRLFAGRYLFFAVPIVAVYVGFVSDTLTIGLRSLASVAWESLGEPSLGITAPPARSVFTVGVPTVLVLLLVSPSLTVVPQSHYQLGPNAPQPDFKGAYTYLDAAADPDDALVAGWTAPAVFYHGDVDYWAVHNLTGAERNWTVDYQTEVYAGAVPLQNATEFRQAVRCHERGWVVLDNIAWQRIDAGMRAEIRNLSAHDVNADGMRVFSWSSAGDCGAAIT